MAAGTVQAAAEAGGGHSVEDTMDKVDPQLLMRDTRVLVELVKEFADEAHLPFDAAGCLAQMRDTVADIRTLAAMTLISLL